MWFDTKFGKICFQNDAIGIMISMATLNEFLTNNNTDKGKTTYPENYVKELLVPLNLAVFSLS